MAEKSDSEEVTSALRSVTRGVGAHFFGMAVTKGLGLVTNLLLTRALGTSLYGIYSFGNSLMSIAGIFANLGTDQSIIRFVPQYDERTAQNRVIGLAAATSLVAGLAVGAILYVSAPFLTRLTLNQPLLTDVLRLFAFTLPFYTLIGCVGSVFRSMELPGYQILSSSIGFQAFRLVTIGVAVVIGASVVGVVAAVVVAFALAFVFAVGLFVSRTDFRPTVGGSRQQIFEFYNFSIPLTVGDAGTLLQNKVDILMVGFFLSGSAVGIYNISSVVTQLIGLPLVGFNTMFPPIAARMYGNDELADLEALFTRVTRWSFTLSLLPSLGLLVYSNEVLSVFGNDFAAGSEVLALFALGQLASATVGSSGYLLTMTGHQYLRLANEWGLGISNVVFNYLFITQFGLIGAALATAGTLAAVNIVRVIEVWYVEGLVPYSSKFLKPVVAGLASGALMEGWKLFSPLSGYTLLIVGGVTGTLMFGLVLITVGIESEDREFFQELVA